MTRRDLVTIIRALCLSGDKETGCLYAAEYDDGIVKIGKSGTPEQRNRSLRFYRGEKHDVVKFWHSKKLAHINTAEQEARCGFPLAEIDGCEECVTVPFEVAVKQIRDVESKDCYQLEERP